MIPPEMPQELRAFLTRLTLFDSANNVAAHVSQVLENNASDRGRSVILDIDAFKETDFPPSEPAIEPTFGMLRNLKNNIFSTA